MSRVTRIKHLKREDDTDNLDLPTSNQKIARIVKSAGNNLHEVDGKIDLRVFCALYIPLVRLSFCSIFLRFGVYRKLPRIYANEIQKKFVD